MKLGLHKIKFNGVRGSIKIASASFAAIIFLIAFDSLGIFPVPVLRGIKTILLIAGNLILIGETFFEERHRFEWDFPTIMATTTIIGVFLLAAATMLQLPKETFIIGQIFANEFVVYIVLGIFLVMELFRIDIKAKRKR